MSVLLPFSAPLVRGQFLRRYKRFFVDIRLDDGTEVVAHTANTGAMTGLLEVGAPALLTRHDNKGRAYPLELEALRLPSGSDVARGLPPRSESLRGACPRDPDVARGLPPPSGSLRGACPRDPDVARGLPPRSGWVSVNTAAANAFAAQVIRAGLVDELRGYGTIRHEVRAHPRSKSRLDLLLSSVKDQCFVEVKSVTLRDGDRALFPDAVSERGRKHLDALARLAKRHRAAMLYVVKRADCTSFAPAYDIDPEYCRALKRAAKAGVEVYCVAMDVVDDGLEYVGRLPVAL